jgi:hypothetical protein
MAAHPLLIDGQIISSFANSYLLAKGLFFHGPLFRVLNGQPLSALSSSATQDQSSSPRGHSNKKAVGSFPLRVAEICQVLFHSLDPTEKY